MSHEPQNQLAAQSSCRARRIRDEEWEKHRPTIEKLYGECGHSRTAVIERLKQDGFAVTEKQLKHILSKWKLKKKIASTDMELMLATKRQRDVEGKATQFTYHGCAVDEGKLQRSAKRLKTLNASSAVMPSYIQALSPRSSNRSPHLGRATPTTGLQNSINDPISSSQTYRQTARSRQGTPFWPQHQENFVLDPNDGHFELSQQQNGEGSGDSQSIPTAVSENSLLNDLTDLFTPTDNPTNFDEILGGNLLSNNDNSMTNIPIWSLPPEKSVSSNVLDLGTRFPVQLPNSMFTPSPGSRIAVREPVGGLGIGQSSVAQSIRDENTPNNVLFYGSNPENTISSIQTIRTLIQDFQDEEFYQSHLFLRGLYGTKLINEMKNAILLPEIDEVALWAYEASAKFIRHKQRPCILGNPSVSPEIESTEQVACHDQFSHQNQSASKNADCSRMGSALVSYCEAPAYSKMFTTLRIELRRTFQEAFNNESDALSYIEILTVPEVRNRSEAGIRIGFLGRSRDLPLFTTIKTYNVVPNDSEVIKCVTMNDTQGFRKLVKERKASPRDIDTNGTSLLHYAIFGGCSEIFRYLLENGANPEQCHIHTNLANLIDSIWNYNVDLNIALGGSMIGFPTMKYIKDIDQCRSMTEIAFANGCHVEESIPHNQTSPSPLFRISTSQERHSITRQFTDTVKQLLAVGYNKERRNGRGQTPLLFATNVTTLRSLTVVRLFLAAKMKTDAVDSQGRSALHLCLDFSECLSESFQKIHRISSSAFEEPKISENITMTETITGKKGDEACSDMASSDQEPGVSFTRSEDDDNLGTPNITEQLEECYWCGDSPNPEALDLEESSFYMYCEARDIDDFAMPAGILGDEKYADFEPEPWMCKARQRLKLLLLLHAGCNPNALDNNGASPSDYARSERLWQQWEWALAQTGWRYNELTDRCERKDVTPEFRLEDLLELSDGPLEAVEA